MAMFGKNKKGSLLDLIMIGVIMIFFAMVLLIGFKVANSFNTQVQSMSVFDANAKAASNQLVGNYSGVLDGASFFLLIILAIATFILAALVRVHPIFIPVFIIALLILIFLCGIFSNIYQEMAADPNLSTEAASLIFTSNILTYLPFIIGIFGFILMIVMFKLWSNAQ